MYNVKFVNEEAFNRHSPPSGEIRETHTQEEVAYMYIFYCRYLILPSEIKYARNRPSITSTHTSSVRPSVTEIITSSNRLFQCATLQLSRAIWPPVQGRRSGRSSHRPWKVRGSARTYFSRTLVSALRFRCIAL